MNSQNEMRKFIELTDALDRRFHLLRPPEVRILLQRTGPNLTSEEHTIN